jgi:hypothetical protein
MKNFLLLKWAHRSIRPSIYCLALGFLFGGPWGLIGGLVMGIIIFPVVLIFSAWFTYLSSSIKPGVFTGSKPSDNLRPDDMFRF